MPQISQETDAADCGREGELLAWEQVVLKIQELKIKMNAEERNFNSCRAVCRP